MHSARPRLGPVIVIVVLACASTAQTPPAWRYDLRPGDHLTYRYTLQRRTQSNDEQTEVNARFRTHVLVVAADAQRISLGFQRNREAAELSAYSSKGKDRLAREKPEFDKRMQKRPSHFSEAMEISPEGRPRYSWEVARESSSHFLGVLHEVVSLPSVPVAKEETWRQSTLPGLDLRWADDESIHGKMCHRVEAATSDGALKLSYWWSPESGLIEQVSLDGSYSSYGDTVHEMARMELESQTRGEELGSWLSSSETRQGALQALLLTPEAPLPSEQLARVLASDEPASQSLALAIASRRNSKVPASILDSLRRSTNNLVQALVASYSYSPSPLPSVEECHRPVPLKPTPKKFGTTMETAPATKDDPEISYLVRIPLSYHENRPAPLLVYLSGGAGLAIDGVNTAEDIVSQTDYLVLYPQANAYWWKPEVARRFDSVLYDVLRRYNVDRDRVYLTGFSNGGTGAVYFATLWPQRFAAVVSLMGAGECVEEVKAGLPNLGNLPLLIVHGENDPVIAPDCSRTTKSALAELHPANKPELQILPNRVHDITLQTDDGLTLAFFKNKLRNPFPRAVDLSESDALAARSYWIEILDGRPGKSNVEARVKAGNSIDIHSHDVRHLRLHLRPELLPRPGDIRIDWNGKKKFSGPLRDVCSLATPPSTEDPKLDLTDTRDLALP